jgi:hypothetical protein
VKFVVKLDEGDLNVTLEWHDSAMPNAPSEDTIHAPIDEVGCGFPKRDRMVRSNCKSDQLAKICSDFTSHLALHTNSAAGTNYAGFCKDLVFKAKAKEK